MPGNFADVEEMLGISVKSEKCHGIVREKKFSGKSA